MLLCKSITEHGLGVHYTFFILSSRFSCSWLRLELELPTPGAICLICLASVDSSPSLQPQWINVVNLDYLYNPLLVHFSDLVTHYWNACTLQKFYLNHTIFNVPPRGFDCTVFSYIQLFLCGLNMGSPWSVTKLIISIKRYFVNIFLMY